GLIAIVILYVLFSILMSTFDSPSKMTYPATLIGLIVSIPFAGYTCVRVSETKNSGLGGLCGLIYIIILYFISSVMNNDFSIGFNTFILLVIGVLAGTIGGLVYMNRAGARKAKRNRTFIGKAK
ncbi:MAG TPA: TIGR04086 family membrane protein, partial [Clostridiales bacterium]|nr:TIGR04086 family membrane protein [Clostridiales bacterium]